MNLVWNWPQIVWAILVALNLLIAAALDGRPRKGTHSLASSMLAALLSFALLYFGGFFAGATP